MKFLIAILLASITVNLYADKKWIPLEPINKAKSQKKSTKSDTRLSQFQPIAKLVQNAVVIKQLLDGSKREEKTLNNAKNWYKLDNEKSN